MSNHNKSRQTEKTGTKMALNHSKSSELYWQDRVMFWNTSDKHYSARISYKGKRKVFKLHTANKKTASKKARDIYMDLLINGWQEEKKQEIITDTTIGDVVRVYLQLTEASPTTAGNYVRVFRSVVRDIIEADQEDQEADTSDKDKFDYVNGGNKKWKQSIDEVLLSEITQAKVQKWKVAYVNKRSDTPLRKKSATASASSYIRYCKSIFRPELVEHMKKEITLPDELPFAVVKAYKRQKTKYVSSFSVVDIMKKAKNELPGIEQDQQWLAFVLAISTGMRRNEIDKLAWQQINFKDDFINISATENFEAKGSEGCVDIEPELSTMLKGYYARYKDAGEFVIQSEIVHAYKGKTPKYRANRHLNAVVTWLRKNGVKAYKPIQTLRKEAGSEVCRQYGLHAASTFLRHADIQVTSNHYVENKENIVSGLGAMLAVDIEDIEQGRKAE
jgi:integrase